MGTRRSRGIALVVAIATVMIATALTCPAAEKGKTQDQGIWNEVQPRGPGRGAPGPRRIEPTKDEIDRILESFRQRDPKAAADLAKLRKKNPARFMDELRKRARDEFAKIMRERRNNFLEKWRERRRNDFLKWLQKTFPSDAQEMAELKDSDPNLYGRKYDLAWRSYGRIFDESGRNPELGNILVEDVKLKRIEDGLVSKIKASTDQGEKEKLEAELEQVIGNRYDLILKRKQLIYEWLLKRLDELQKRINDSRADMLKYQDPKVKAENVEQRAKSLLEKQKGFRWD
jgi:hypothetical protein